VLIEQSAYANRWRAVSPAAKAVYALCGIVAAFAAVSPAAALTVAALLAASTMLGAKVPPGRYLHVATPALFFLATSRLAHWRPCSSWS